MRKTILMLINGFGIEKKDSTEVYSASLMPNFDSMIKNYLFGTLNASAGDVSLGYKQFSIPTVEEKKEDEIDKLILDKKLGSIESLNLIKNNFSNENTLHIFYTIQNSSKVIQIREIIKEVNANKDKNIYVHLILTSTSVNDYSEVLKTINKLAYEVSEYSKIGLIVGKNMVNSAEFSKTLEREYGEQWKEFDKKIDTLKRDIINPEDAEVFMINKGFAFNEGDSIIFANYIDVDLSSIIAFAKTKSMDLYSLYYVKDDIINMFVKDETVVDCLSKKLDQFGIKILHLTEKERVDDANFYFNGMKKVKGSNLSFALNDQSMLGTKESISNILNDDNFHGIIIDFDIGKCNRLEDIKNMLRYIDSIIKNISEIAVSKDYTFIISSLYGMHASIADGVLEKLVNFSGKVPCIYQSNEFNKKEYSLNNGSVHDLGLTFLTNICDEVKANKLVHKMNAIEKMLSKK